jgi:predicted ATP-grasp superfamily ATP-dependent carboligase
MLKYVEHMNKDEKTVLYVTRDLERALGIAPNPQYQIVTNRTPYSESIQAQFPGFIHFVESQEILHTYGLIDQFNFDSFFKISNLQSSNVAIVVFKNSSIIENLSRKKGLFLLNPSSELSEKIENKISQSNWLGELGNKYLPPHKIDIIKNIMWAKKPLVIQWSHGHTGNGTIIVNTEEELLAVKNKFPERYARVSDYINCSTFTVNVVVAGNNVLVGNISYQITGLQPFTDNIFSTIGNDWSVVGSLLSESEIKYIEDMAVEIGTKMSAQGWRGLFGIDVIKDLERNAIHLIEINARQPASTSFEAKLQNDIVNNANIQGINIFEAHIDALKGQSVTQKMIQINDGSQVVLRVHKDIDHISDEIIGSLQLSGYTIIQYQNTELNMDLLRIQNPKGVMSGHNSWNDRGREIVETITSTNLDLDKI